MGDDVITGVLASRVDGKNVVSILLSDSVPGEMKKFHCPNCGRTVFNYYTRLKVVLKGGIQKGMKNPIDIQCSRCDLICRVE